MSTPNNIAKPLINNGHITGTSAAQRITLPGYVKGVGTFDNVNFTGTFSPGLSPTILSVGNISLLHPQARSSWNSAARTAGSGYDQIQTSGSLTFDGTLHRDADQRLSHPPPASRSTCSTGSRAADFDTLQLPTLPGLTWNTSQLYNTGVLSVAAAGVPGDYNNNGTVDAGDYVLWRNTTTRQPRSRMIPPPGPTHPTSPFVLDFGQALGSGTGTNATAAVPEPTILLMLVMGMLVMSCHRRHPTWSRALQPGGTLVQTFQTNYRTTACLLALSLLAGAGRKISSASATCRAER